MSSHDTMNQSRGVTMRHVMEPAHPNEHLLEQILSGSNLQQAWKRVRANKGKPGVDKMAIEDFPAFARSHWVTINQALFADNYQPSPVLRVEIPKSSGGTRPLGIPTVMDRLIQQAIAQVLTPVFDPLFSRFSFGFRPGKSAHQAVYQVREYIRQGYRIAVDMDLSKFFDTVDHDVLMNRVAQKIRDKRLLHLIGKYLRAGVKVNGRLRKTRCGVPQGGPLSPLLANILLHDLDVELEKRGHRFVRYADDFIILVKSHRAGERVMESIRHFLGHRLKLTVNEEKSRIAPAHKISFLGFTFKGTGIRWSDTSFNQFKWKVKHLTGRSWFVSMEHRFEKLARYLRGWMNYFGISEHYRPLPEIDHWLRRRVRMCYFKQWRKTRTRVRNLLKLGVSLNAALAAGISRKSYWRLARTPGTQVGMSNQWLKDQGLLSVKELWVNIHYPTTVR